MVISELFQVTQRLKTEFPWIVEAKFFDRVDSTQKRITKFLPKTGEGGVLVIAETQTKGTGRQGRPWSSPPGGIWFSLALPLGNLPLEKVPPFSVVTAYLIQKALQDTINLKCDFKWPNDIQVKGKKVAGILLGTTTKFKKGWVLIGIGVNVNNAVPANLAKEATSIQEVRGNSVGRSRLIEAFLGAIWIAWEDFARTGFGPYKKGVESCLTGVGKTASINVGNKKVEAVIDGIDPQGGLMLKSGSGTQTIHAGEIIGQPA